MFHGKNTKLLELSWNQNNQTRFNFDVYDIYHKKISRVPVKAHQKFFLTALSFLFSKLPSSRQWTKYDAYLHGFKDTTR